MLHYSVTVEVPGYYGGTAGFYLADSYTRIKYNGVEYFFGQDAASIRVYTVNGLGETRDYSPYAGDSSDYTFLYVPDSSDPRVFYLGFNVATASTGGSNWLETEDVTLHIEYNLPLTAPVYLRPDGTHYVLSGDTTLGDLVDLGLAVKNRARLYYNGTLQHVQSDAEYQEVPDTPIHKLGRVRGDGVIEYTVIFINRDAAGGSILQPQMKELIFHDTLLTPGMSYVEGSLYCDIYNSDLTRIRQIYHYTGTMNGAGALSASSVDFTWFGGDGSPYTTLYEYAQHTTIGGSSSSTPRLVFRYQVQVDRDAPIFQTADLTVPLDNRARLTGILPDDAPFDSGSADCTVLYDTEIVKKEVAHAEGSNRADFTITINPSGTDLSPEITQMTVEDRMTMNLQPVLRTIQVYYRIADLWEEQAPQYTYDQSLNILSFTLPDDVAVKISYTTLITEAGESVGIGNSVELVGFAVYSAVVDTSFRVDDTGGAAHADNFRLTLLKQAADTHQPLPGAEFALYGPAHSLRQGTPPAGTPATVTAHGQTLYYYTSYVTGPDGTAELETNDDGLAMFSIQGLYALKEISPPRGYELMAEPVCFYADERPAGGLEDIRVLLSDAPLAAEDQPIAYALPDTGGPGRRAVMVPGALIVAAGSVWLRRRRKAVCR